MNNTLEDAIIIDMALEVPKNIKSLLEGARNRSRQQDRRVNGGSDGPEGTQEGQSLEDQAGAFLNRKIEPYRQKAEALKQKGEELKQKAEGLKKDLDSGKEFMNRLTRSVANVRKGDDLDAEDREYFSGALNQFDVKTNKLTKDLSAEDQEMTEEMLESARIVLWSRNKLKLAYQGAKLGFSLRKAAEASEFRGLSFYYVMGLSLIKDLLDFSDGVGFIGMAASLLIWGALMIFYFGKGSFIKKLVIRRLFAVMVFEMIPVLNFIPAYTLLSLYVKYVMDSRVRKYVDMADDIQKDSRSILGNISQARSVVRRVRSRGKAEGA